jgi:hypothetical protein
LLFDKTCVPFQTSPPPTEVPEEFSMSNLKSGVPVGVPYIKPLLILFGHATDTSKENLAAGVTEIGDTEMVQSL